MQRVCADTVLVCISRPAVCPYMKGPLSDSDDDEDVSLFGKSTASVRHAKYEIQKQDQKNAENVFFNVTVRHIIYKPNCRH